MNLKIDLTFYIKHLRAHVIKANKNSSITEPVHCGVFEYDIHCLHFFCLVSSQPWARKPNNFEVMPKKTLSNTWLFCVLNVFQIKLLWSMHKSKSKTRYPGAMAMEHTKRLRHKPDNLSTHYSFNISQPQKKDILVHQQKTIVICASHSNALWGSRWVWAGQEGCMRWCWWRRKKSIFCCCCMREETITLCCCGQDIHQPAKQRHQASDRRIIFHNWQKSLTGLMRGTQIVPWPRKNNLLLNITMNWLWKITRRNPVDSAIVVQVAVVFSTSCRGCPLMVLWMRTSRNTVESHILHSLTRKTKVTGHLLEDKTASIDPKCKLYIRPKGSLQFITALLRSEI